jgi:hypothetical protein
VTQPSCLPEPDRRDAWETGDLRWDAFYLLVFGAVLAIVLIDTPGSAVAAGAATAALVPWYLLVGRPLWTGGRGGTARAAIYVTGLSCCSASRRARIPTPGSSRSRSRRNSSAS